MKKNSMPPGWDGARVQRVLAHYENQSDAQAAAEDDAAFAAGATVMRVPKSLVPAVRAMIAQSTPPGRKRSPVRSRRAG